MPCLRTRVLFGILTVALLAAASNAVAADDALVTAVYAKVDSDYKRTKNPDGSFPIETYLVAKGRYMAAGKKDDSIDDVKFSGLVRALAKYLAPQNYYPARVPKDAKLMLVIYWGTTAPFNESVYRSSVDRAADAMGAAMQQNSARPSAPTGGGAAANEQRRAQDSHASQDALEDAAEQAVLEANIANRSRERADAYNANLLGYMKDINYYDTSAKSYGFGDHYNDLVSDIEEERYFVIVGAYDFQEMLQHQKKKLLWSTRVSIRARGNRFDATLFAMLENASKYFGKDSGGLRKLEDKTPTVNLGELKILGAVTPSAPAEK